MKTIPIALVAFAVTLLSCINDETAVRSGHQEIGFSLNGQTEWHTTRGVAVNDVNMESVYADNVGVVAFKAGDGSEYIPQQPLLSPNASDLLWHTAGRYYWPQSGSLIFWAWAPMELPSGKGSGFTPIFSDDRNVMSFSYAMQSPDAAVRADAVTQSDLVIARTVADRNTGNGGVSLSFIHPLTSVTFSAGDVRDGIIRTISLKNIMGSGECVYDGSSIVWTPSGSPATFIQTFNATVSEGLYGQPVTLAGEPLGERTFMVIPQTLGTGTAIEVVFDDGVETSVLSYPLDGTEWLAGMNCNYRISLTPNYPDGYGISVEETFDGYEKSHVSMKNNTEKNLYIRAAIIANWVDADGSIVAPCNIQTDGSISGFDVFSVGGRWTLHSDGFLYYKKAIRPGKNTLDLFTKYTPGTPAVAGSMLEMTIMIQGVEYDKNMKLAEKAWGVNLPLAGSIE